MQAAPDPGSTLSAKALGKLSYKVEQALSRLKALKYKRKIDTNDYQNMSQQLKTDKKTLSNHETEISVEQKKAIQKNVDAVSRLCSKWQKIRLGARSAWKGTKNKLGLRTPSSQAAKSAGATLGAASVAAAAHTEENSLTQANTVDQEQQDRDETDKPSDTDATTTAEPAAEQGVWGKMSSMIWGASTEEPALKEKDTKTKQEKKSATQKQPSSTPNTSDQPEAVDAPEKPDLPEKKESDLDAAVVEEDKASQDEDTASANPEDPKQQGWSEYFSSFLK